MILQRLTAIPIIILTWLVTNTFRLIPLSLCWKIGNTLGTLAHTFMPERRAIIRRNLTNVASQNPNIQVTDILVKQVFQRSITNLTCAVKTYTMTPSKASSTVSSSIHPDLNHAITEKTGAVICLAHMGNWELLTKLAPLVTPETFPFGAVYRPLDNKPLDNYISGQRKKNGCQMFPKGKSITNLTTFIRQGGVLGILADQRAGGSKNNRPFFGHPSSRSKLPAILHLRTKAPLFSVSLHSPSPGKWHISINPISTPQEATTEQIVTLITQSYESIFSKHLLDVFWLHTYWREKRTRRKRPHNNAP